MGFLGVYILKSSVCLALLYLFYRLLLSKETFHRFNRWALMGICCLSMVIPGMEIQVHHPGEVQQMVFSLEQFLSMSVDEPLLAVHTVSSKITVWLIGLGWLIYGVGVVFFMIRNLYTLFQLSRLSSQCHRESLTAYLPSYTGSASLRICEQVISPFSWWHSIFISRADLQESGREILIHELAHIRKRHSWDLLVADCCIFVQWFNPAAWLLKQELQAVHEYEADEAVLQAGVNAKQYQLLIIKKAVGARLYSMANSLNHSSLKKRITMMMKEKSNPWARMKYLYILPVAAIAVTAFARPEVSAVANQISSAKINDFKSVIETKTFVKDDTVKYVPIVDPVKRQLKGEVFTAVDEMPQFANGGMSGLLKYLAQNIRYPKSAQKEDKQGRVIVTFVVAPDGSIQNAHVLRGVDAAIDAEALRVINSMPKWIPGRENGVAVPVKYTLPVTFSLADKANRGNRVNAPIESLAKESMVIIDGKEGTQADLQKLTSSEIAHVTVYKDDEAVARYGEKARSGVIVVVSKK